MHETSRRELLALAASLAAAPALAQPATNSAASPAVRPDSVAVALATPQGRIVLALATGQAPVTAGNFLRYVDRRLYDGASFYRASRPAGATTGDSGLVQGGLENDPKKVLAPIAHESTLQTGLAHTDGTISMARRAPGTAQADWFICVGDQAYLDADPKDPANLGFAAFGHVTEGMEIVRRILLMPTDPNKGVGRMRGEMLRDPVPILAARRV